MKSLIATRRAVCILCFIALAWAVARAEPPGLDEGFRNVPPADRPWVYYWWLNGNVDEKTITRDLEAMKQNGIGGLLLFDARGYHDDKDHVMAPPSKMEFMSPAWRQMVKFTLAKADQLGLQVSINLSICAGALKGPWEVGDDAPKKLVWTSADVAGPKSFAADLLRPEGRRFRDVAVMAVRHDHPPATNPAETLSGNWRELSTKPEGTSTVAETVNLDGKVDAHGRLTWEVPAGHWTILRFGCATMEGHEYDVDILDPKAVTGHFERMGRVLLNDAGPLAGKTLTHFYSVSWEGAAPTWTLALEKEFAGFRGYALRPWLPVLAGFTVNSRAESERFLHDYYKTLADCFANNFYGTLRDLSNRAGLKWHSESGGPWDRKIAAFAHADQFAFLAQNDMPQGEFWWPRRSMNRPAAMTAHIYGKRLAATEAFTHMVQHWSAYPATLKPRADAAFCDGINQFVWHTFTASPADLGLPGSEYFAGTHINPNVTWWAMARPFLDYLARGQFMLRQGRFVADACVYVGDKPYLHWDQGATNWSSRTTLRWPRGHAFDLVTTDVLLNRLTAKDGDLVLPDGMTYRMLIVDPDDETILLPALQKISALKKAGVTVIVGQRKPQRAPGLAEYPACDDEVRKLADALWSADGRSPEEVLKAKNIPPDFEAPWDYTHRRDGDGDLYFVAGRGTNDCTFRVHGKQPELWNPVTGEIRAPDSWRTSSDGRTIVSLSLPTNGSTFVVFRRPAHQPQRDAQPQPVVEAIALAGPWNVRFEPGRGAPESAVFDELVSWDRHADAGIRFFSGRATYRRSIELSAKQAERSARLQLGDVKYIAQVRVNGKDLGIVWTAPWSLALDGALRPGRNEIQVDVVNTWVNRLIGDAALPPERRITKTNVTLEPGKRTLKAYQSFAAEDPLMPSGLLGPVRLEFTGPAPAP